MCLRFDDDLRALIDGGDTRIPLDHALARRHLRTLIVRAITLADAALCAASILGMCSQPLANLRGIAFEAFDPPRRFRRGIGLCRGGIRRTMPLHHPRRRRFELLRLSREIGARATPVLGRIARQLHAIDREHFAPDQTLLITHRQDSGKHARDIGAQGADELRDRREVRRLVPAARSTGISFGCVSMYL